jgi:hypothetical protein
MSEPAGSAPSGAAEATAPFPGLRPFNRSDHAYFFGREDQTFALYRLLRTNHFVAVVGSSGSGKSSIVRAGLLPLLDQENEQSGRKVWQCIEMRPGADSINQLAISLAKAVGDKDEFFAARRDRIAAMLFASSHGLTEALPHTVTEADTQLIVLVDQFEELFRYLSAGAKTQTRLETVKRREEATNFIQLLLAATRSHDSRIRVIITMRSDFIGDCSRFQGLPEAVCSAQFLVPSLSRDQREEAVRGPIELSGATISSELVERLLNDSSDELDQLPVLQHCLARLWMRAGAASTNPDGATPGRHLTEADYKEIGGVSGAISGHAEEIFSSLSGRENTVEQIFRALAEIDSEGRAIRRARQLGQLIAETGASHDDVFAVLDKFRADDCSFLVPPLTSSPSRDLPEDTIIDVGHEALLRRWARVCGDPEATDERGDKREIGWLRQELKDAERYRFLHSCVDPQSLNESDLSGDQARRYWEWWDGRRPNKAWAARYGGRHEDVERLVQDSHVRRGRNQKLAKAGRAGAVFAVVLLAAGAIYTYQQRKLSAETFEEVTKSTQALSSAVLESFNSGETSLQAAGKFREIAEKLYDRFDDLPDTAAVARLKASWRLTSSDLNIALANKANARSDAQNAAETARTYLAANPDDASWQRLLYGSLFRLGDLDLDDSLIRDNSVAMIEPKQASLARAISEYQESERIADKLLNFEVSHPKEINPAGMDYLANQRFELAFAINKTGEALQVKKDYRGALAKFREALDYAVLIQDASKPQWKLQSAATRTKIGRVLRDAGDVDGALQSFSEAVERQESLYQNQPGNKMVRSNLAASYEDRAELYKAKDKTNHDRVLDEYAKATRLYTTLSEEDPRDVGMLEHLAKLYAKSGAEEEQKASDENRPAVQAVNDYTQEVDVRKKLTQRRPGDAILQNHLHDSNAKLARVRETAAAPAKEVTDKAAEAK